jgi:hypothetical protein
MQRRCIQAQHEHGGQGSNRRAICEEARFRILAIEAACIAKDVKINVDLTCHGLPLLDSP